jgi:putative ABC transport system substrate-binding protein
VKLSAVALLCLALIAVPPAAEAQETGKVYRIGFLRPGPLPKTWAEAFQRGLRERRYIEGQNVVVEYGFTDGSFNELPGLADELVRLRVDMVVASALPAALAAQKATTNGADCLCGRVRSGGDRTRPEPGPP